jgi:ribosomal-protein-alanine N-acetyltransferase
MIVIKTNRLYLREFVFSDAESLYRLNLDPEVMRYTGDRAFASVEEAEQFLQAYDHYRHYGYGRWALVGKNDDEFIGWCGLKYTPGPNECDIGFRLLKSHWNQGLATEAAKACIHHGFENLLLPRIVGRAMRDNLSSVAVLKKIGLSFLRTSDFDGHEGVVYGIDATDHHVAIGII